MYCRRELLLVLATVLLCCTQAKIQAGTGEVIRTPVPSVRNTTGLKLQIDTQWVDASGYRDIRIHVATATGTPSPSDRELRIEIAPSSYNDNEDKFIVSQFVTLNQGDRQTTAHLLVPQNRPWHQINTRVYEGGRLSRQLSARSSINNHSGDQWSEAVAAVLVIDSAAPSLLDRYYRDASSPPLPETISDVRALEMLVKRATFNASDEKRPTDTELLRRVAATPRLELIAPSDLPERWIGLTCFDLIVISRDDLTGMSRSHSTRFDAIVDWTSAGGNLLIYGIGDKYERLTSTEKLLAMNPTTINEDYQAAGWTKAQTALFNDQPLRQFQELQSYGRYYDYGSDEQPAEPSVGPPPNVKNAFGTSSSNKFLHRPLGMGLVLAVAADDPFPGTSTDWNWVLNTIGENRAMWYRRNGLSMRRKNNDYWNFLVPETGKAPVLAFCVLITLFAIFIGPVNYFVLSRQRRLYMLLATIPLGALLTTLGLFGYALITDGLETQVRVRSYTHLDQTAGRMENWSRQSYYAGLAPSRGLTFPTDTAVFRVEQFPHHEEDYRWERPKAMQWISPNQGGGGQNLESGYITSRITSQFVTLRTGESSALLKLDQRTAPSSARNMLGGDLQFLLLCDAAGNFFTAVETPAGEKTTLTSADYDTVKLEFHKTMLASEPAPPDGLDPNQFENWTAQNWSQWGMLDSGLAEASGSSSLMEQRIAKLRTMREKQFPRATYIALISKSPEVPLGAEATENGSLHIVEGEF